MSNRNFDTETYDAITELINIGVGRAAASLSDLIGQRIELTVPSIRVCEAVDSQVVMLSRAHYTETVITQTFDGLIQGRPSLCLPTASSIALAQLLSGTSVAGQAELDAELSGILLEVGNIVLNGVMGSLSNAMSAVLRYSIPELQTAGRRGERLIRDAVQEKDILLVDVRFSVSQQAIEGSIIVVFSVGSVRAMIDAILRPQAA
jgi:chemotaxis protein CheC